MRPLALGVTLALALVGGAPLLEGCSSAVVVLSPDEFDRLPRDSRQEIFDAENDLVIARNRQDEAADKRAAADRALDKLDDRWKRTEKRLSGGPQAGRIGQARKAYDANRAYIKALGNVADEAMETTYREAELSRARLLLVKQRQAARIGRAQLGTLKPLEERVAEAEAKVKAAANVQNEARAKAQTQLEAWKAAEDEYASGSGDYDTGVWE